jgi:hypothetical protein
MRPGALSNRIFDFKRDYATRELELSGYISEGEWEGHAVSTCLPGQQLMANVSWRWSRSFSVKGLGECE